MSLITRGLGQSGEIRAISSIKIEAVAQAITIEIEVPTITIELTEEGETTDMISIKQGEAKTLSFTITDSEGLAIPLTDATMSFAVKEQKIDTEYIIEKSHDAFDLTNASNGIVTLSLSKIDTAIEPESYVAELKAEIDSNNIIKSEDIDFVVEKSVFH